jgi:hypothetical protein
MGLTPVNRKYPRATIDQPGVMTVRSSDQRLPNRKVAVAIRSISPEGVGLALQNDRPPLERRSTVVMDFRVDGHHFEIPGQIVWVASNPAQRGPLDVGIRFQLAAVTNDTRLAYARWVVDYLRKRGLDMQVQQPPPKRS